MKKNKIVSTLLLSAACFCIGSMNSPVMASAKGNPERKSPKKADPRNFFQRHAPQVMGGLSTPTPEEEEQMPAEEAHSADLERAASAQEHVLNERAGNDDEDDRNRAEAERRARAVNRDQKRHVEVAGDGEAALEHLQAAKEADAVADAHHLEAERILQAQRAAETNPMAKRLGRTETELMSMTKEQKKALMRNRKK